MAYRINNNAGNWDSATLWDTVVNVPTMHATTNITVTGTLFTAVFTAPNTTNYSTGIAFFVNAVGSAGTITCTLQEYNGATWVDTAATGAFTVTNLTANSLAYLRWGTAYQYATTTVGYYRVKYVLTGGAGTTRFNANSAGTASAYLASDDRTGALGATDDVFVVGDNTTSRTVTINNTSASCGSGTWTGTISHRAIGVAVTVGAYGILKSSTAASSTLTSLGSIEIAGGELNMTPANRGYLASIIFNENGTSCNYGLACLNSSIGKLTLQGHTRTSWMGTYVSGAGTAADPLITTALDLAVGDEIHVAPTEGYAQGERKYIKTVNSSTSYVIANSVGGAESALAYTHDAGADIFSVTKNVVIKTDDATEGFFASFENSTAGNVDIDETRFENVGSTLANKAGIYVGTISTLPSTYIDNSVCYNVLYQGFVFNTNPASGSKTYTNLISGFNKSNNVNNAYSLTVSSAVKSLIFTNVIAYDFGRSGINMSGPAHTLAGVKAIACSQQIATNFGLVCSTASNLTATNFESYSNRGYGIDLLSITPGNFTNAQLGIKGSNDAGDIFCALDSYNDVLFTDSNFGSASFVVGYLNQTTGSKVNFHNKNDLSMAHFSYTPEGINQCTGTGLADTTEITAGSKTLRLAPESTSPGDTVEFLVYTKANTPIAVYGTALMNAALAGDAGASATVEIWIPGVTSASATTTLTKNTTANIWSLSANYTGTVNGFSTVKINAKSTTAGAYLYIDNIFNGTNAITSFDTWHKGQPSPIMFEQLGDAAAVWAVLTSTLTTSGTIGNLVKKLLTVGKFLALK